MRRVACLCLVLTLSVAVSQAGCAPAAAPEPAPPVEEPTAAPSAPTPTPVPSGGEAPSPTSTPIPLLLLSSAAFDPGGEIPVRYSCHGENLSPPLAWSGVTQGIYSLALVMDDPDSQPPSFVHWVIYNIPPSSTSLPEGVPAEPTLPDGSLQGMNDYALFAEEGQTFPGGAPINRVGYDGPCPGDTHRYVFRLYALDTVVDLPAEATMADLLVAMEGHVLGQAEFTGVFTP